ncbi:MAG: serine protease, partial [Caldimonas sp.]
MSLRRPFLLFVSVLLASVTPVASAAPPGQPTRPTAASAPPAPSSPEAATSAAGAAAAAPVSLSAKKIYEQARSQLVQIRTVLKGRASQTSVGSGFFVTKEGLIVTNFHVVSEAALKPERHDLVYVTADGREAPLQILQLDVLHDLALLKAADAGGSRFDALAFRPEAEPLAQGERIYSLGNPLDVGFAVVQGTYNGLVKRSFYPQIFFGGALSGGMSGGPALDEEGHVIGINVARRVDGEQVSFLVPAAFASALLARGKDAPPLSGPAYGIVDEQLQKHQALLTERFIQQGWKPATHPRYQVPVPPDVFMRCWGSSEPSRTGGLDFERSDCVMDTRIFVGDFNTGTISLRHESYDGSKLGPLRFAARYSQSFRNEGFTRLSAQHQTKPRCNEDFIDRDGL